jgi:hypothetical protein
MMGIKCIMACVSFMHARIQQCHNILYLVAVSEDLEKSDLTTHQENDYDIPKTTI